MTDGIKYRNSWKDYVQCLKELNCSSSESQYVDEFINQINHPDYDYVVETLKAISNCTLAKCFHHVNVKAQDLDKPKPGIINQSIIPRNLQMMTEEIDTSKYIQSNRCIRLLQDIF